MPSPEITPRSWIMVGLLGLTWGSTFLVIELALEGITPAWLAAGRLGFAAVLMLGVLAWRRAPLFLQPPTAKDLILLMVVALLSSIIAFLFLNWGQQYVTSGFAGVSMAAVALIVLPLAHFLIPGEQITLLKSLGFLVGFAGVCVLIGAQAFDSTGSPLEPWGRAATLTTAACYAVSSVLMRRLPPMDPITLAGAILFIGTAVAVPAAWVMEGPPVAPSKETLLWIALLGLVPTAGANVLRVLVIRSAGPTFMSITNYLVPPFSVLIGWLILAEPLPGSLLWALALILSGVALSQYKTLKTLLNGRS
ncbi:Permease of the drug/metabolite transporter (DMT) superfamily [Candidatus Rhodobacter oscarellae]|uniref:Permease of the drug/metabolite transporter (DMT) superfamily n=1 Tax=Candidatus Rhodobacter oscarellae TaxID=1675527 RepID=A0A0J9E249_9RHOB|nr:DMT family transporter [Candidatus Rhodobacter lobularis]KMW56767.1 Permease of the drug/metabolite transporter (DMT) superfamily [Candidatus Rhodobacter lobularis]